MSDIEKSTLDKLSDLFGESNTQEGFLLSRNLGIGASGVSVVLLVAILQLDNFTVELVISTIGLSVAIPMWVAYSGSMEHFIQLGPKYFSHYKVVKGYLSFMALIAGCGLTVSIGSLFWYISVWAGVVFIITVFFAFITSDLFSRRFANSIFG